MDELSDNSRSRSPSTGRKITAKEADEFYMKQTRAKASRNIKNEKLRTEMSQNELKECFFQPNITSVRNDNSKDSVAYFTTVKDLNGDLAENVTFTQNASIFAQSRRSFDRFLKD